MEGLYCLVTKITYKLPSFYGRHVTHPKKGKGEYLPLILGSAPLLFVFKLIVNNTVPSTLPSIAEHIV